MKIHLSTPGASGKHLQIEKAAKSTIAVIAVATIVTIFCLVSIKALAAQAAHQRRVLKAKNAAVDQLKKNISAVNTLVTQFKVFNDGNPNIIGGIADNTSKGPTDGDNARITLDALPSSYDFPALISSFEKILANNGIGSPAIAGTDLGNDNASQQGKPAPVPIPITLGGSAAYTSVQNLVRDIERSIRPFDVSTMQLAGNQGNLEVQLTLNTFYQQARNLNINSKDIK